jgi:hypothetical protein
LLICDGKKSEKEEQKRTEMAKNEKRIIKGV